MTKLPVISGKRLLKILEQQGFVVSRIQGSHHRLKHPDGRHTVVPVHGNDDIQRPLLRDILSQAGISIDEYLLLLQRD